MCAYLRVFACSWYAVDNVRYRWHATQLACLDAIIGTFWANIHKLVAEGKHRKVGASIKREKHFMNVFT